VRTTLDIDNDVMEAARELARMHNESIGAVISSLARSGLRPSRVDIVDGLPIIRVSTASTVITSEMVRSALDDK